MGHSVVIGRSSEIEVRDSTFELILDRVLEHLRSGSAGRSEANEDMLRLVESWADYWKQMPPGCKDLDVSSLDSLGTLVLVDAVERVLQEAAGGSETELLTRRFLDILRGLPLTE